MTPTRNTAKAWRRVVVAAVLGCAVTASAQSRFGNWGRPDIPYDGGVTFVRLRWTEGTYGAGTAGRGGRNMWLHEFPRAEQNLMTMLEDFTLVDANTQASLILTLDDPHLFKHPIALMQEPGFWVMTDEQAARLRAYLLKGGFVIFNDFEGNHWENFEAQMGRVLPGSQWHRLDISHPIFDAFFRIEKVDIPNPRYHHLFGRVPEYFGLFEDNDPNGRMMAVANYNTNLAEYWQMGGMGYFPIEPMSVGFELGINYMLYSLTR
ncbi:MAG: DUF4159 domain-containing protein [Rhodospirillaceae bacterium]|nr:DUF4159 domain-containing protein [Rhodospirillaceae bacterium]